MREPADPREAARIETPTVTEEERRSRELATGAETVGFSGIQERLKAVLARLSSKGLTVVGGDALLMARADGQTSGDLANLTASVESAVRDGESKELLPVVAEVARATTEVAISGGENVSGSNYFTAALTNGLNGLMGNTPARGRDDGGRSA